MSYPTPPPRCRMCYELFLAALMVAALATFFTYALKMTTIGFTTM